MARVTKVVSDVTGVEADASEVVKLIVRKHPAITTPKQLDMLPGELDGLKPATDLVVVEVDGVEVLASHREFAKLVSDDVVVAAQGTRGRRKGYSPTNKKGA